MYLQLVRICLTHFTNCFIYEFLFKVISKRTLCSKDFKRYLREIKIISTFIPTNVGTNRKNLKEE